MKIEIQPELKRYYYGIGLLGVLIFGIILVNIVGNTSLRHDYRLEGKIGEIQEKIDSHISSRNKLPDILPDVGIQESGGVEYKRINDERYMLCATFRTKSDGYSAPDRYYVDNLKSESLAAGVSLDTNTHFTNGDSQGLEHEKGYSCIVYQPRRLSDTYLYPYRLCDVEKFKLQPLYSQTVESVNTTARQIVIGKVNYQYEYNNSRAASPNTVTYTLNPGAKVYDLQCKETELAIIKPGDMIEIYQKTLGTTADGVLLTYSSNPPLPTKPGTTRAQ